MDKRFTIAVAPVLVDSSKVPTEYRINFVGTGVVDGIVIAYNDLEARTVSFATAGAYTATAGLYDQNGDLLGATASASFTVETSGTTVEVRGVSGLTVDVVPATPPAVARR